MVTRPPQLVLEVLSLGSLVLKEFLLVSDKLGRGLLDLFNAYRLDIIMELNRHTRGDADSKAVAVADDDDEHDTHPDCWLCGAAALR